MLRIWRRVFSAANAPVISSGISPSTLAARARAAEPGGLSWMPHAPEASRSEPGGSRWARLWPANRKAMTCRRSALMDAPTWLPPGMALNPSRCRSKLLLAIGTVARDRGAAGDTSPCHTWTRSVTRTIATGRSLLPASRTVAC